MTPPADAIVRLIRDVLIRPVIERGHVVRYAVEERGRLARRRFT